MYTQFYGLREKPFSLAPDPRFLFLSVSHREALAHLLYGIEQGEGFIAITGEVGTGKTTLCRTLLQRLEPGAEVAFVFNPPQSGLELLQAIAAELGVVAAGRDRWQLTEELNRFLLERRREGRRVLLLVDEAQNLPADALEEVRLLSNLETDTSKLLQILLIGQPELDAILDAPELRQLRQRISVRWRLRPLTAAETRRYVRHRMRIAAGAERDVFTDLALREIHRRARGIPRLVNRLCDRALLAGYAAGAHTVGLGLVSRTERELRGGGRPPPAESAKAGGRRRLRRGLLAAGLLVVGGGAAIALVEPLREAGRAALGGAPASSEPAVAAAPEAAVPEAPARRSEAASDPEPDGPESAPEVARVDAGASEPAATQPRTGTASAEDGSGTPAKPGARRSASEPSEEGRRAYGEGGGESAARVSPKGSREARPDEAPERAELGAALARVSPARSAAASLDALLESWERPPLGEELLAPDRAPEKLRQAGLAVLPLRDAGWETLERYNQPVLLRLRALDGAPRLAALTGISPDGRALLRGLGERAPRRVARAELERHWDGRGWLSWRDFEELPHILRPGSRGAPVTWLQKRLGELGLYAVPPSGEFDDDTVIAVRALQERLRVHVDGTVGPRTKVRLYEYLSAYDVPRLRPASGETG